MLNIYSTIKNHAGFNKIEVDELLFVEYTCLREETKFGIWSDSNYFAFITSGKKAWNTTQRSYQVTEGDILFVKKGANHTHQFFDTEFCAVFMFIPDEFIRYFLDANAYLLKKERAVRKYHDSVIPVKRNEILTVYQHSIQSYLRLSAKPDLPLLKLKFEELLLSLFATGENPDLTDYLLSLNNSREHKVRSVMEANFAYNLKLEDYAQLCHMSLSTFKKIFGEVFGITPASWLKEQKLALAAHKLVNSSLPVNQISFECGFEDTSHFIRVFRQKYGLTPLQYKNTHTSINKRINSTARSIFQT